MAISDFFTPKQVKVFHAYETKPFKIMILSGAVRSGKTFIDNVLFLNELRRVANLAKLHNDKHPRFILAGATSGSIYNNVISELQTQFGLILKPDFHNHYHLFDVDIVPVYTSSISGLSSARGFTAYGAYVNEASLANHEVFNEIQNRCSQPGSHIICDTNPDIPTHWLKTDFIDNHDPDSGIISFNFTIDDNTFLDPDYVKSMKASKPSGMFYDRDILGLWVTGEGIVYQDFDAKKMVIDDSKIPEGLHYYCGVDWGFEHPNPILLLGDDDQGNTYVLRDYTKKHKFINYWIKIAQNLQDEFGRNLIFYADSARPDNVNEFQAAGINCINANKNVLPGIECVAQKMREGKFFVAKSCSQGLMNEIYQYAWDENTGQPLKENDVRHNDRLDALRYAIYSKNAKGGYIPWN